MSINFKVLLASVFLFIFATDVYGSAVTGIILFSSGTKAKADEVNLNFINVKIAVDDNHSRLIILEALPAAHGDGTNAPPGNAIAGVDANGNFQGVFDVETDAEALNHKSNPSAHHVKTVDTNVTNLGATTTATTVTITSDTGGSALIPQAGATAGVLSAADKTKLDGIAIGAQVDTNTNAATICATATDVLQGDGTCAAGGQFTGGTMFIHPTVASPIGNDNAGSSWSILADGTASFLEVTTPDIPGSNGVEVNDNPFGNMPPAPAAGLLGLYPADNGEWYKRDPVDAAPVRIVTTEEMTNSGLNWATVGTFTSRRSVITEFGNARSVSGTELLGAMHIAADGFPPAATVYTLADVSTIGAGMSVCFYDIDSLGIITIEIDSTDSITLDGVQLTNGNTIDSPGAVGDSICLLSIDNSGRWVTLNRSGVWVDGGPT